MAHTFQDLKMKTVAQLRDIAKETEHEAIKGYSSMHKADLLQALCTALGIEGHEPHEVVGADKAQIKVKIRELKTKREAALDAHDPKQLKFLRRRIHRLKRKLRAASV